MGSKESNKDLDSLQTGYQNQSLFLWKILFHYSTFYISLGTILIGYSSFLEDYKGFNQYIQKRNYKQNIKYNPNETTSQHLV